MPRNTTLVQIGFTYGLNYPFVANNGASANQIFSFLPQGIAYALGISVDNVTMHALQPYDTTTHLGYVTTLAMFYIPSSLVNTLELDLRTAVSSLYANPDPSISTLMSMINPSFPVIAGVALDSDGSGSAGSGSTGSTGSSAQSNTNAAPLSMQQTAGTGTSSSPVRGTSVGIAVGVVAGAALYAAAMFYVARRYKRHKLGHARASSVTQAMSQNNLGGLNYGAMAGAGAGGGAAVMSGANGAGASDANGFGQYDTRDSHGSGGTGSGRSARTGMISAPVMAENSLGWH